MSAIALEWLSRWQYESSTAPITSGSERRDASVLVRVVSQFDVENQDRYRPGKPGPTWCNIFVWDCTRALGCEVPHWIRGKELTANELVEWLAGSLHNGGTKQGPAHGWRGCSRADVRARALLGFPCLITYSNPNPARSGHIAIVLPSGVAVGDDVQIAQAGATCHAYAPYNSATCFGNLPVRFWTHD